MLPDPALSKCCPSFQEPCQGLCSSEAYPPGTQTAVPIFHLKKWAQLDAICLVLHQGRVNTTIQYCPVSSLYHSLALDMVVFP